MAHDQCSPVIATPEMVKAAYKAYENDEILHKADDWLEAVINAALAAAPALSSAGSATQREAALEKAARDFIAKVDRGEARSIYSYRAFQSALALPSVAQPSAGSDYDHGFRAGVACEQDAAERRGVAKPSAESNPLYDSRNPNHGRSGGLRIPDVAQPPAGAFDDWFDRHFLDPDGGSSHLPDWLKDDLRLAWDAAPSSTQQESGK